MTGHKHSNLRFHPQFILNTRHKPIHLLKASLLVATLGLSACGDEKSDADYLASAKNYLNNGDVQSASIELKNSLQQNPSNSEARYLLGTLYLKQQQGAQAEKEFNRAAENGYPKSALVDELAQAYYYQFKYDDLLNTTIQQEALSPEEKSQVLFLRGMANLSLQRKQDAEADLAESAKANTGGKFSLLSNAYLDAVDEKLDSAMLTTLKVLESSPDFAEGNILAGKLSFTQKDIEKAVQFQAKAIESEPNRLQLYIDMARYQTAAKNFDEADKNIDVVLKVAPNHLPSNLIKASLAIQNKNWEKAREHADKALAVSEINKQAKLLSGMANFYLENWELSREKLKAVAPFLGDQHIAKRMLAYTEFKLGYAQNADDILNSIGSTEKQDSALLSQFGTKLVQQGNIEEALKLYGKASEINPEDAGIKTRLGFLKLQQNNLEGVADLESVIATDEDDQWARSGLVRFHVSQKNYDEAEKVAREFINAKPELSDGYLLTASVFAAQEKFAEALTFLNQGLSKLPTDIKLLIDRAKILSIQGNQKVAQETLDQALAQAPYDKNVLMANYRLGKDLSERKSALEQIEKAAQANPEDDSYKMLYALALMDQRDIEGAYQQLSAVSPESSVYSRAQMALGNIAARQNKLEAALSHFDEVLSQDKTLKMAYQAKVVTQAKMGKQKDALETIEQALNLFPGDQNLQLKEVELLLNQNQINQAEKKAKRYSITHGESHILETILGRHYIKGTETQRALTHLAKAHELNPSTFTVINLAQAHTKSGKKNLALETINDWIKSNPNDHAAQMYLANIQLNTDHSSAIKQYRSLLEKNPNNLVALNNLAWALGEQGELAQALTFAEKAFQLRAVPPVIDTYAYLLFQNGEHDKALPLLKQAHEQAKNEPSIAYHYALALDKNGEKENAKQILESIIEQDFPEKANAQALLNSM